MSKKLEDIHKRHSAIKSIISARDIFNQTQLVKILKQEGIKITQATLSRDLAELGVARIPTPRGAVYRINAVGDEPTLRLHVAEEIVSIIANEALVVVKTFPGRAQGVAAFIDKSLFKESLGTLAGDDTIIVIPKSTKTIDKTVEQLKIILGIK